ncbi:MAG: 4-hydroxy-tetrahydrodipicolinate reductase [Bacteroidota bacterium]
MIKTCLLGLGKTGSIVAEKLLNSFEFDLTSVICKPGSAKIGTPLKDHLKTESDLLIAGADNLVDEYKEKHFQIAIDFTSPEATLRNAPILAGKGVHLVIGTNGFSNKQLQELKSLVQYHRIGLVYAPNLSVGINLLVSMVKTIARLIPNYHVEITETETRGETLSHSGTAVKIADDIKIIKETAKRNRYQLGHHDVSKIVKFKSVPAENGGFHKVRFSGESEEIEIMHRSNSGAIYAEGALKAAAFILNLKGFYHMDDVLLLERMDRDFRLAANRLYLNFN